MMDKKHVLGLLALIALAASVPLAGCVGYSSYPVADGQLAGTDPNQPAAEEVMTAALRWAVQRYPIGEDEIAINLPVGVRADTYRKVVGKVSPSALPVQGIPETRPVYHVRMVWVRGPKAQVEIVRPVESFGTGADAPSIAQGVTVWLEGGLRPWSVQRHRTWRIGTLDTPELYPIGEAEELSERLSRGSDDSSDD